MNLTDLRQKIENKQAVIGVIGLGYVGLPVACVFAEAGFRVIGVDIDADRVAKINRGMSPIEGNEPGLADLLKVVVKDSHFRATTDYNELSDVDVFTINVETPVDENHQPRYVALRSACHSLGSVMKEGALVVVESTIAPGTIDRVVRPLLEEISGKNEGLDFFVGACPERVMPGKLLHNLRQLGRVCGGSTPEVAETMVSLYRHIVKADLDTANPVTAELVKTTENAYRDVQIAFANEVALICEAVGGDVWQVRELVNKTPYRQMHLPGAGVGGHCIPKDPWLLAYAAGEAVPLRLIPAARAVNEAMPYHMADLVVQALAEVGIPIQQAKVAVLGYAYLENSDDTRNSPSAVLVARLQSLGADVVVHDPWLPAYQGDLYERIQDSNVIAIMVKHEEYFNLDIVRLESMMQTPILVDGRNLYTNSHLLSSSFYYLSIGIG